jgi:cell fate (sporulation/competence/biofilm development) regulator YmcA (YheA/YmcA/DUF963 family)
MEEKKILKEMDELKIIQKRFELITVARYRDKAKMKKASEEIDKIRKKAGVGGKSTTEILREWRDKRCASSS